MRRLIPRAAERRDNLDRSFGLTALAAVLLTAGLAGLAATWAVWPRTSNTSPLAALLTSVWSCVFILSAVLIWRRSPIAAPVFVGAMGLLFPLFWFLFLGNLAVSLPLFAAIIAVGSIGYRYVRRAVRVSAPD